MKKSLFYIIIGILLIFTVSMFSNSVYAACLNPTDSYAVEVVLNKPGTTHNIESLRKAQNVDFINGEYVFRSQATPHVATIISQESDPVEGVSVRLQMPLKSEIKKIPYLKLTSRVKVGVFTLDESKISDGWEIGCSNDNPISRCVFQKDDLTITFDRFASDKYVADIEILREFSGCEVCSGECVVYLGNKVCIENRIVSDIEEILETTKVFSSFKDFTLSVRGEKGFKEIKDLTPIYNESIDWKDSLFRELLWLGNSGIVSIDFSDIDKISSLAVQGMSGQNNRIVYEDDKWVYYKDTSFPVLSKQIICTEFSDSLISSETPKFQTSYIPTYWLFPVYIAVFLLILFLVLIIISRIYFLFNKKRK